MNYDEIQSVIDNIMDHKSSLDFSDYVKSCVGKESFSLTSIAARYLNLLVKRYISEPLLSLYLLHLLQPYLLIYLWPLKIIRYQKQVIMLHYCLWTHNQYIYQCFESSLYGYQADIRFYEGLSSVVCQLHFVQVVCHHLSL